MENCYIASANNFKLRSRKLEQLVILSSQSGDCCQRRFQAGEFDRLLDAIDIGGIFDRFHKRFPDWIDFDAG